VVATKKLPESAASAVKRAQNVADALKTMNPEIPLEDHAYLLMDDDFHIRGTTGSIAVLPQGSHAVHFESRNPNIKIISYGAITLSVEEGKYYTIATEKKNAIKGIVGITELSDDEEKLERAKQDVAGIKEYFEYSRNHPNALDGTYMDHKLVLNIHENRLSFIKMNEEILFDGETIIFFRNGNHYLLNIWYYHFNKDGNMEVIQDAKSILTGYNAVTVFERVPDHP